MIASARSIYQLYAARLIFGIALAIPFTILPMYIGEIAEVSFSFTFNTLCNNVI